MRVSLSRDKTVFFSKESASLQGRERERHVKGNLARSGYILRLIYTRSATVSSLYRYMYMDSVYEKEEE